MTKTERVERLEKQIEEAEAMILIMGQRRSEKLRLVRRLKDELFILKTSLPEEGEK